MDKEQPIYICNPDNSSFVKRLFKAQQQNAEFIDIYSRVFWLDKNNNMKLFREHRGGLEESLVTTIECPNGLSDIKEYFENNSPFPGYYNGIRMDLSMRDNRLPEEWGNRQYVVLAETKDRKTVVLGFCNFWEDVPRPNISIAYEDEN